MKTIGSLKELWPKYLSTLFLGCLFIFIPIVRDFHLETATITALLFSMISAHVAFLDNYTDRDKYILTYILQLVFVIPIAFGALFSGCFGLEGIYFQILIPFLTVGFVLTVSLFLRKYVLWIKKYHLILIILTLAIVPPLVSLKLFPHLFLFNIIWGWFPGPIYDEAVIIGLPLIWHRGFVLLLTILLLLLYIKPRRGVFIFAPILILFTVVHVSNWKKFGIIHPISYIENTLGGRFESDNFILIYEQGAVSEQELNYWIFWHEYHFRDLKDRLQVQEFNSKVVSFLYTDGWQKQTYTGARRTSYVPVWNKRDQLHIDRQSGAAVLRHELVHVLMKSSANPIVGASINIGLTEGVASAFDDPRFRRMTNSEVIVNSGFEPDFSYIQKVFSFLGFYTGRSAVNYAISGSFIGFMLDQGYIDEFKCAYRGGSFNNCFNSDFEGLFDSWSQYLNSIPADSNYRPHAEELFNRESLFERKCARIPSKTEVKLNSYQKLRTRGQITEALDILEGVFSCNPQSINLWNTFSYMKLQEGQPYVVFEYTNQEIIDSHPSALLRLADSSFMIGNLHEAQKTIETYIEHSFGMVSKQSLSLRGFAVVDDQLMSDLETWNKFIDLYYNTSSVSKTILSNYTVDQINLWLSLIHSQQASSYIDMREIVAYLNISMLNRENLMYLADVLIPYSDISSLEDKNINPYRINEILDQIENNSYGIVHREQMNLLHSAIVN
jgi:hypothetical protein